MKRQLKPVTGALLAGLVGFAHAACYWETTYVCLDADEWIDGGPWDPRCGVNPITSTINWYGRDIHQGSGRSGLITDQYCNGPARMWNCNENSYYNVGNLAIDWVSTYSMIDPNSSICP